MRATAVALGSSALALVWIAGTAVIAGALTPGYSHVGQFLSELGASGARYESAVRFAGFLPAGLFLWGFCVAALRALPRNRKTVAGVVGIAIYAAGYVAAAAFPCDPGCRPPEPSTAQAIHNAIGLLGYALAPVALLLLALAARHWPAARRLSHLGYASALLATAGLLTLDPASPLVGLSQRLIEGALLGWCAACGLYLDAARRSQRAVAPSGASY